MGWLLGVLAIVLPLAVHMAGRLVGGRMVGVRGASGRDGPLGRRVVVALGGGAANYLAAVALMMGTYLVYGEATPDGPPSVERVMPGTPAERAGLRAGDEIVSVGGVAVAEVAQVAALVERSAGAPVAIEVRRDGELRRVELRAALLDGRYRAGVALLPVTRYHRVSLAHATGQSLMFPPRYTAWVGRGLADVFVGRRQGNFVGPVGVVRQVSRTHGADATYALAVLDVYWGWSSLIVGLIAALIPRRQRREKTAMATAPAKSISTTVT